MNRVHAQELVKAIDDLIQRRIVQQHAHRRDVETHETMCQVHIDTIVEILEAT